jgi:3-hydroxyisobutyrate dehydrogenase-like beta-hydroxyacid dehydrogenase
MAQNFLKHGYDVYVWNRTKDHVGPLLAAGARWCESPTAVAESSDIIIECVTNDEASREVWTSADTGILTGAVPGKTYIVSSSLSIAWVDELAQLCASKELPFMDMPLTGSRAGAEGGTLRLLVGADDATLDAVRADLKAISEKIYHFGPAGSGMRFKLILNMLIAIHVNAAAQAASLAQRAGLDIHSVFDALFDGAMGPASPATAMLYKNMDASPDHVNFAAKWMAKDLGYAQDMAKRYGIDIDLLDATAADYTRLLHDGLADQDLTKITQLYRR